MGLKSLEILKKGLKTLQNEVKAKKEQHQAQLAAQKPISSEDEAWLDQDGNLVDFVAVVDTLETASDYERGLIELDVQQQGLIRKLREAAGDLAKTVGKKQKHMACPYWTFTCEQNLKLRAKAKAKQAPVFTKKEVATLKQRIEILDWHNANGKNQSKTAKHFTPLYPNLVIKQPLISAWVKEEAKWQDQWAEAAGNSDCTAKWQHQTQHPEMTEMMDLWVSKAMAEGILLTGDVLQAKWK
ncbi:hypothetical protein H2248_010439 [Termitomyces sp. 'cryptogamus']|nr:hypothetical protein H2248_010439 [Termitomyces sp. 'cryptogamus']